MGGGLESRCVGRVYGADGAMHHPHRDSVQKAICCNLTSNAPDDGHVYPKHGCVYPKHVELRIHQ